MANPITKVRSIPCIQAGERIIGRREPLLMADTPGETCYGLVLLQVLPSFSFLRSVEACHHAGLVRIEGGRCPSRHRVGLVIPFPLPSPRVDVRSDAS